MILLACMQEDLATTTHELERACKEIDSLKADIHEAGKC